MNPSISAKLTALAERFEEISALLGDPQIIADQNQFRELSKEYAQLEPIIKCYQRYNTLAATIESATQLLQESDPEIKILAEEELQQAQTEQTQLVEQIHILLIPKNPNDDRDVYLEIRAGTGGDEAAIFAGDLFRMYARFIEQRRWRLEVISASEGEHGGFKEIITKITGEAVYSALKFESGAHRVQRVPETEAQGRIHTSACTVAILPVVEGVDEIKIKTEDLRIDTYRSSGAGGQHVNTTDSAIRITHLPSGLVVECQDERSQHKNKAKAMSLLQSRLLMLEQQRLQQEQASTRKLLVGTGDRSERIRTYNYPQNRITDHRINLTLYHLDEIMEGDLEPVIQPLIQEYQMDQLSQMGIE